MQDKNLSSENSDTIKLQISSHNSSQQSNDSIWIVPVLALVGYVQVKTVNENCIVLLIGLLMLYDLYMSPSVVSWGRLPAWMNFSAHFKLGPIMF